MTFGAHGAGWAGSIPAPRLGRPVLVDVTVLPTGLPLATRVTFVTRDSETQNRRLTAMTRKYTYIDTDNEDELIEEPEAHAYTGFLEWVKLYNVNVDIAIHAADATLHIRHGAYDGGQCEVEIDGCESKDAMRHIRNALGGGRWTKTFTDWSYNESREFSPHLVVTLEAYRSMVCKRVKVGTKMVTKPDPKALEALRDTVKQVTVEEPVYEWEC